ncbi:MAG: IS200/IS605 family transposase [bacterium]|nr:IS200/IS605 family transposase [bacterium]
MAQSYCNLLYHLVFGTKERRPWLADQVRPRIHEYLGGVIRGEGGIPLAIGGTPDHLHALVRLRQDRAVSAVLCAVKSNSSGWIHKTFPALEKFAWQDGYGAFTVSASQLDKVRGYVLNQEEHHKTTSFEEEFARLLRAHGVEFDERYLLA